MNIKKKSIEAGDSTNNRMIRATTRRQGALKKGGVFSLVVVMLVVSSLYLVNLQGPLMNRHNALVGAAGVGPHTGWVNFQIRPHAAVPGTTYAANCTNASAYEYGTGNMSALGSTPYGTAFDIVVTVSIDYNDGYNQGTSQWDNTYNWLTCTCSDLGIAANSNMTEILIGSNSVQAWYHYYLNNGGPGYTVILGQSFNITSFKYWVKAINT